MLGKEIQSGHHRFPHLCARCGRENVAGLWPLPVQAKPQIHAASLLTVAFGSLVLEETEKIVAVPVCAACTEWLAKQKTVDTWFSRLATVGITIGILGGIALSIWWVPFDRLNGWIMALFMAGCVVVGIAVAYLLTALLFRDHRSGNDTAVAHLRPALATPMDKMLWRARRVGPC